MSVLVNLHVHVCALGIAVSVLCVMTASVLHVMTALQHAASRDSQCTACFDSKRCV